MISRILYGLAAYASIFGAGVVVGYYSASNRCELEKMEFQNDALEKQAQADRKAQSVENVYKNALIDAQSGISLDLGKISTDFNDAKRDFFDSLASDSVHHNETGADSAKSVSVTPATARTVSKETCRCSAKDQAKFQRLYERQLVIAKDCDITATYYNHLLEMYQSVSDKR